jgi:SAM-dependent methyltransferase
MQEHERDAMLAADARHWWYRGRRAVVSSVLDQTVVPSRFPRALDAGCGSGRTLDLLRGYGQPVGIDVDGHAVQVAIARGHDVREASVLSLPFGDGAFGLVTCLDVLEHLDDDLEALRELRRVTAPGGALVVTVPAYQVLWSAHDERNLHRRRYRSSQLASAAESAGWVVERQTYFNSLLLGPAALVRLADRARGASPESSDLARTPARLDALLEKPMRLEAWLIARGLRLPAGLSALAVLRKGQPAIAAPRSVAIAPRSATAATG